MIIFGSARALYNSIFLSGVDSGFGPGVSIYNINSPTKFGEPLSNLFPSVIPQGLFPGEYEYDLYLANYICNDNLAFSSFMHIIYDDYMGKIVYVLVDKSWWSMIYVESLLKFIQARYGFTPNLINEPDDITTCKQTEYSIAGRQQLQADKERFIYLNYDQFMKDVKEEGDE